jgi:hypothetical protein
MKHLSEEELLEHYYGEGPRRDVERHLRGCPECTAAYDDLGRELGAIKPQPLPERSADYGESVWRALRNSVPVYEPQRKWLSPIALRGFGYASAFALLVLVAFIAGRRWEHSHSTENLLAGDPLARKRIVLVVMSDHLDRSERLLIELRHTTNIPGDSPVRAEARDLLAQNRLYRESAAQVGDPTLSAALDHLERVLVEVANDPDGLSQADAMRLRKEMNSDGLLFEIRVLRTRVSDREDKDATQPKGATT